MYSYIVYHLNLVKYINRKLKNLNEIEICCIFLPQKSQDRQSKADIEAPKSLATWLFSIFAFYLSSIRGFPSSKLPHYPRQLLDLQPSYLYSNQEEKERRKLLAEVFSPMSQPYLK